MSLDDERVRFYFRHRDQIEQWAALRSEAAAAMDEWLEQLGPDIEELALELGSDVRVRSWVGPEFQYPAYRMVREGWGFGDVDEPPACVSLEWVRGRVTMRGNAAPYVGLRSSKGSELGAKLRASGERTRVARNDQRSSWWLGYGYVLPASEFPSSPDATEAYRKRLIEALRSAWHAYAPLVTNAGG